MNEIGLIQDALRWDTTRATRPIIPDTVIPLVTPSSTAKLCLTQKGWRTWGHFRADVEVLRPQIAEAQTLCNLSGNRYAFLVGLAAGLLNGQRTLLPSSAAPENVRRTIEEFSDVLILGEGLPEIEARRLVEIPVGEAISDAAQLSDRLLEASGEIRVHTSGSTGSPVAHIKTFAALAGGSNLTENLFAQSGLDTTPGVLTIIGTTPFQHMFGLEAAVTAPLVYGHPVVEQTPILPGDLECVLEHTRKHGCEEIALVTSPAHLKYLEPIIHATPEIRTILSATAPLPMSLAERLEARGDLAVMEIYGSTETGSLAGRRTIQGPDWTPMNGFELREDGDGHWHAMAPHLTQSETLADALDMGAGGKFRLLGRLGDMITVAGKRNNLGALNAALAEADGISSGCYVILRDGPDVETDLGIVVVPSDVTDVTGLKKRVRTHMSKLVDPVFVPRNIVFAETIHRDATGKIPDFEVRRLRKRFD